VIAVAGAFLSLIVILATWPLGPRLAPRIHSRAGTGAESEILALRVAKTSSDPPADRNVGMTDWCV
jgi:hypothetical protein